VEISVTDNGCGIPGDLLGQVFDPFFSTKANHNGTGLGLAMVRRFAEETGGCVRLESQVGEGTTVSLLLPAAISAGTTIVEATMPLSTLPVGNERILVFSDDGQVCATVDQILRLLGYRVTVARRLGESIDAVQAGAVDLALIDIKGRIHPEADQLIAMLATPDRPVRAVIIRDSMSKHYSGVPTILKPFDLAGVANTVRRVLNGE
jgi:CheY-like chemotaxis protein